MHEQKKKKERKKGGKGREEVLRRTVFMRDGNNHHCVREKEGDIEQERENTRLSLTREGGAPLFATENFLPSRESEIEIERGIVAERERRRHTSRDGDFLSREREIGRSWEREIPGEKERMIGREERD